MSLTVASIEHSLMRTGVDGGAIMGVGTKRPRTACDGRGHGTERVISMQAQRTTGSWVLRCRNEYGPDEYVRHVNGRDVWIDEAVNAAVFPTKKAAFAALRQVRNRSRFYAERSTAHEAYQQAERDVSGRNARDDEAARAYRRMWGEELPDV